MIKPLCLCGGERYGACDDQKGVRRLDDFQEKLNSILSSPAEMEKIMAIARSFSGESAPAPSQDTGPPDVPASAPAPPDPAPSGFTLDGLDPDMIAMMARVMQESNKSNGKTAIIGAIAPHLREERRGKLEQALKIAQMAGVAKILFGSGGGDAS